MGSRPTRGLAGVAATATPAKADDWHRDWHHYGWRHDGWSHGWYGPRVGIGVYPPSYYYQPYYPRVYYPQTYYAPSYYPAYGGLSVTIPIR